MYIEQGGWIRQLCQQHGVGGITAGDNVIVAGFTPFQVARYQALFRFTQCINGRLFQTKPQ